MARKRLGELLVEEGLLDPVGLRRALVEQRRWGGQLGAILVDLKLVSEEAVVGTLSRQLGLPNVELEGRDISGDILALVPSELAERHRMVPFNAEGKFLDVAMSDPTNLGIIDELRIRTQLNVRTYLAGPKSIERALLRYYGISVGYQQGVSFAPSDMVLDAPTTPRLGTEDVSIQDLSAEVEEYDPAEEAKAEVRALQERISKLEALVARDEDVIRKLLGLLIDKGVATREEILESIH